MVEAEEFLRWFDRLVVVAPHPDDDVLGCGGAIAAAAATGMDLRVIYVTDGSASHVGSRAYPSERLRDLREGEAREALGILGVHSEPRFLRVPDGTVAALAADAAGAVVAALADAIGDAADPLVIGPWVRDHHTDHVAVAALVRAACARRPGATLLEYAVWLHELGTEHDRPDAAEGTPVALGVARFVAAKSAALAAHRSQLGSLITDAPVSFALPRGLMVATAQPSEHFLLVRQR